jgi:hypothetical protein
MKDLTVFGTVVLDELDSTQLAVTTLPDRVKQFFQRPGVILEASKLGGEEEEENGVEWGAWDVEDAEDLDSEEISEVESVVGDKRVKPKKDSGFYIQLQ